MDSLMLETARFYVPALGNSVEGAAKNIKMYVNGINFKLNLSCRGKFCFLEEIGLTIIKMMTPLRAYSCLLQVYEFVTEWRGEG